MHHAKYVHREFKTVRLHDVITTISVGLFLRSRIRICVTRGEVDMQPLRVKEWVISDAIIM